MENAIGNVNNERAKKRVITYNGNGTKALYHNYNLMHIAGNVYIGDFINTNYSEEVLSRWLENAADEYEKERYIGRYNADKYCSVYVWWPEINLGLFCTKCRYYDEVDDVMARVRREGYDTLDRFKAMVAAKIEVGLHFRFTEIEMMKNIDASIVPDMWDSRRRNEERMQEEKRKRAEEEDRLNKEFLQEQNDKLNETVQNAIDTIRNSGTVQNIQVTIYHSRYNGTTTSLVVYLMRLYNVNVPIKTQGFINGKVTNIVVKDGKCTNYFFDKYKSKGSYNVFKYFDALISAICAE